MPEKVSEFGKWLRKWRKARGLTQKQLAGKSGCVHSLISAYERGVRSDVSGDYMRPETRLVERLATALDRPVEEARALAGYLPSPAPLTQREAYELALQEGARLVEENPQEAAIVMPRGRDGLPYVVVTSGQLAQIIADTVKQVLEQVEKQTTDE